MDLSIIPSSILSSNLRTQIIQTAINERFKCQFTIEQIRTLINLIGTNISFIHNTFLMDGSAHNKFTFEFMLGKGEIVIMPDSLNRLELEQHFENSSGWWYHLFFIFWSRHKLLPNMKCDTVNCSRCVIVDGHQKSKRIQLDQQALANHKEECSNYRDDSEQIRKSRTFGFLASYHPCGVLIWLHGSH
ncbi:unnamed protein product [Adineta steineri]|uniref:Uncharacterized protein n=1 Tax=Adineta steineri TaxID=433720 RepID=A0A815PVP9_9BILA|nr:unnamed protein product [Adineta steineri]